MSRGSKTVAARGAANGADRGVYVATSAAAEPSQSAAQTVASVILRYRFVQTKGRAMYRV
jgi:hypothetical protein